MKILVPISITSANITSSTVTEPSSTQTLWVSGGTYNIGNKVIRKTNYKEYVALTNHTGVATVPEADTTNWKYSAPAEITWVASTSYAIGDVVIRDTTHKKYTCILAHSGITTLPENDPTRWTESGPTEKYAMFDNTVSTQSTAVQTMTYVLAPGFFNALALYKLTGSSVSITVKDTPGGATVHTSTHSLTGTYPDWYEWLFAPYQLTPKILITDIVPYLTAEVTITVTGGTNEPVGIGVCAVGDLRSIASDVWGGVEWGAKAEPIDYSYVKTDEFGNTTIVKRRNATDLRVNIILPTEYADYALATVQEVLATPVAWISISDDGYEGLNVFGLGSGSLSYDNPISSNMQINVKGLV